MVQSSTLSSHPTPPTPPTLGTSDPVAMVPSDPIMGPSDPNVWSCTGTSDAVG